MSSNRIHPTLLALGLSISAAALLPGCGTVDETVGAAESILPDPDKLPELPGVYRLDIQQGSVITQEMVEQLNVGMEPRKVRFILGTPTSVDTFNQRRWDYYYSFKEGGSDTQSRRVSVFFDELGLLERVSQEGDLPKKDVRSDGTIIERDRVVLVPPRTDDGTLLGALISPFTSNDDAPFRRATNELSDDASEAEKEARDAVLKEAPEVGTDIDDSEFETFDSTPDISADDRLDQAIPSPATSESDVFQVANDRDSSAAQADTTADQAADESVVNSVVIGQGREAGENLAEDPDDESFLRGLFKDLGTQAPGVDINDDGS